MQILAIDPGVTTGVAVYDATKNKVLYYFQTMVSGEVIEFIREMRKGISTLVIEDFIGYGRRDKHIIQTVKNLGFYEGYAKLLRYDVTLQQPQMRVAFVPKASEMVGAEMHYTDALAHALAYAYFHAKKVGVRPHVAPGKV